MAFKYFFHVTAQQISYYLEIIQMVRIIRRNCIFYFQYDRLGKLDQSYQWKQVGKLEFFFF